MLLLSACPGSHETRYDDTAARASAFAWALPAHIPLPLEPEDNPMTEEKFQLGRHLFYDRRLSGNGTVACASCHLQSMGFSDGLQRSVGATGEVHPRNAQALVNVAYHSTLNWANPSVTQIEKQVLVPLFGEFPVEHGVNEENKTEILALLASDPVYAELFSAAFPQADELINFENITRALASFVRGLTSFDSDFDRMEAGDANALSPAAKQGMALFFSERLECFHCHGGYNFTDAFVDRSMLFPLRAFHNTGLYNVDGRGAYPADNTGVFEITGEPAHMGSFRAPTLRNIAVTAPYMHDGSIATLDEVIRTYAAGGRNITSGPYAGDGRNNPHKDGFVSGFSITDQEVMDLIDFLESLTDDSFLSNERFANPWETDE